MGIRTMSLVPTKEIENLNWNCPKDMPLHLFGISTVNMLTKYYKLGFQVCVRNRARGKAECGAFRNSSAVLLWQGDFNALPCACMLSTLPKENCPAIHSHNLLHECLNSRKTNLVSFPIWYLEAFMGC